MAIRDLKRGNIVANVLTTDGTFFECCDIPSKPMGEHEKSFSFWVGSIKLYDDELD